jgi:ribosomal protein L31
MLRFKSIYIEDMKSNIHPTYYKDAKVISAGKVIFTTGATVPEIRVDIIINQNTSSTLMRY